MILVDTSLWVDHLRKSNSALSRILEKGEVLTHPFVIGELACGNLKRRAQILGLMELIPMSTLAEHDEVMRLVELRNLYGKGIGWIDAHLVASALLSDATLWTLDNRLRQIAVQIGLAYSKEG